VHRIGRTGCAGASGDALSLCSANERKQLADIEKLIKRPLEVETLEVTQRARRDGSAPRRDERLGRPERTEHRHASRDESGSRRRPAGAHDRPRGRQQPVDEFFLKPYEPSPSAMKRHEETVEPERKSAPKQPLAALLGGLGMPRKSS